MVAVWFDWNAYLFKFLDGTSHQHEGAKEHRHGREQKSKQLIKIRWVIKCGQGEAFALQRSAKTKERNESKDGWN